MPSFMADTPAATNAKLDRFVSDAQSVRSDSMSVHSEYPPLNIVF
jgi:hypothetical protein